MTAPSLSQDEVFRRYQRASDHIRDAIEANNQPAFIRWSKNRKALWNELWGHLLAEATYTLRLNARCYCRNTDPCDACVSGQ